MNNQYFYYSAMGSLVGTDFNECFDISPEVL